VKRFAVVVVAVVLVGAGAYWWMAHSSRQPESSAVVTPPDAALGGASPSAAIPAPHGAAIPSAAPQPPRLGGPPVDSSGSGARQGIGVMRSPGALAKLPDHYTLGKTLSGGVGLNLAGGDPTSVRVSNGFGEPPSGRTLHGRVVDGSGNPIGGALVFVDANGFNIMGADMLADAGTTANADGTFAIDNAPAGTGVAVALDAQQGWSDITPITDAPLTLTLRGHGALHGHATYNGHGESFSLELRQAAPPFQIYYESDPDGTFTFASLRPGDYTLTCGLAQAIGGGVSQQQTQQVTITAGQTTEVAFAQVSKTTVAVTAAPMGMNIMEYWLFSGPAVPADYRAARTRGHTEDAHYNLLGGKDHDTADEFHDVAAGSYVACASGDQGSDFGCTPVTVADGDAVKEIAVTMH
jgi:hypothetical protein